MSTKIYNGYKIPFMSLTELTRFLETVRVGIADCRKTDLIKKMSSMSSEAIDEISVYGCTRIVKPNGSVFNSVISDIFTRSREIVITKIRDRECDFSCNACMLPHDINNERFILVTFYAERDSYIRFWQSLPEVKEYGYWNNTDCPDNVSEEDWDLRKTHWSRVLLDRSPSVPSLWGLSVEFADDNWLFFPEAHEIINDMPALEDRVARLAKRTVEKERFEFLNKNTGEETFGPNFFKGVGDVISWMKTAEGRSEIEKKKDEIRPKLIPVITVENLSMIVPPVIEKNTCN